MNRKNIGIAFGALCGLAGACGYYKVDKPDPFMGAERPDRSAWCIHGGGNGFDGVR